MRMDRTRLLRGDHRSLAYFRTDGTPWPVEEQVALRAFVEREAVSNLELGFRSETGEVIWTSVSAVPVDFPDWRVVMVTVDITARKQAEIALRASELRYRMLFETMAQGVIYYDRDGLITAANPAAARILGRSQEQLLGHSVFAPGWRVIREDGTPFTDADHPARVVLRSGQAVHDLVLGVAAPEQDEVRWLRLHTVPQFQPDEPTPMQIYALFEDITERRQIQQLIAYERRQLATILQTMDEGVMAFHPDGTIALINSAARHLAGLDPVIPLTTLGEMNQALTLQPYDAQGRPIPFEDWPVSRVLRGETFAGVELCLRPAGSDEERWQAVSGTPAYDADGQCILGVLTAQDITRRKQDEVVLRTAYAQLEAHAARLDSLIAHAPIGISLLDPELRFQHINAHLAALNGLPPAAHLGRTIDEVLPALAPDLDPIYRQVLATGKPLLDVEIRGETPAAPGILRTWQASYFPVQVAGGPILGVGVVAIEITQQKQAEVALQAHAEALGRLNAELTRALKLKDEFLAMMSHELRTPLNAILGFTEAMEETLYGPLTERQQQALAQIDDSGHHLLRILSDILDLARIEAGAEQIEREPVDVEVLCQSVLRLIAGRAAQKRITLLRTLAVGVVGLWADERRLIQILVNLLDNAVKFTPAGGKVGLEVLADAAQEQISFTVWDTGIGIAANDMDRLFQPFTQVDARLARAYEGIGLGLTLVRRLTELHGGSVQLESTPGVGSRFTIILPWSEADNHIVRSVMPTEVSTQPVWPRPPRVVVADDDEMTLNLYAEHLAQLGCRVATARTGVEALTQVRAQHPDVLLLDIQMPELDGLSVIERIRADATLRATPIIAVTALAMPGDRERCLDAGATAYLAKPVSLRTLLATIGEVVPGDKTGSDHAEG